MTLCGECKTLQLAIQIVEPPGINEPRNCGGPVTEQIETTTRTNFSRSLKSAQVLASVLSGGQIGRATNRWPLFWSASARHQPVHRHGVSPATASAPRDKRTEALAHRVRQIRAIAGGTNWVGCFGQAQVGHLGSLRPRGVAWRPGCLSWCSLIAQECTKRLLAAMRATGE
jgi:hypothetical protein